MMLQLQAVLVLCLVAGTWAGSFSPELQQHIVDWHNAARRARNATNMNKLEWDDDLEVEISKLVNRCGSRSMDLKNHLLRKIADEDQETYNLTEYIDSAMQHWDDVTSTWSNYRGRMNIKWHWTAATFERWSSDQHIGIAKSNTIGCAYKVCEVRGTRRDYHMQFDHNFNFACMYGPRGTSMTYQNEQPFKTGGAPCSECTVGQTCDDGLCVGYRCTDILGSKYCGRLSRFIRCPYRQRQWKEEVCPVTCNSCPKIEP